MCALVLSAVSFLVLFPVCVYLSGHNVVTHYQSGGLVVLDISAHWKQNEFSRILQIRIDTEPLLT